MDPVWGYEAINVEAQQSDPSSLLSWMRNMIALRKLFQVFGRGTLEFLIPPTARFWPISASTKTSECCAWPIFRASPSRWNSICPHTPAWYRSRCWAMSSSPKIEKTPYPITLDPYGFLWLELQGALEPEEPELPADAGLRLQHAADWKTVLAGAARERLEQEWLPAFLPKQRWFGAKSRQISTTAVHDWGRMGDDALALVEITYAGGDRDTYFVPLSITVGSGGDALAKNHANAILATVRTPDGNGYLHDGMFDDETAREFLTLIGDAGEVTMQHGKVCGVPSAHFAELRGEETLEPRRGSAEQSNTSILFGSR